MPYVIKDGSDEKIKVPDAEYTVLNLLAKLGKEVHGPVIARASGGAVSVGSIYKLLGRLEERGLIRKREEFVPSGDIQVKRVLYTCESFTAAPV